MGMPAVDNTDTGALLTLTAQGAATLFSSSQINERCRGVIVVVNITAASGTPTLVVTLQGYDQASGASYTLLASAAIATTGLTTLTVYPGCPATTNVSANMPLPKLWIVKAVIAGTTPSFTGTIGASVIV